MAYLGNAPARSFISFERQVFTIVNSQTAYTLSHSVTNENDIRLVVNNVVQEPGSGKAYTASGTTLTLSAALTNGTDEMYCVFLGRAVGTVNAPAGSVSTSQLAGDAVTEAKIADGAVESEHLNNNVISGQTELAAEPADTDEFLVSDAGTLKRIDYSHIKASPGLTFINSFTPSGSASTISLTGIFTSSFRNYRIVCDGLSIATNNSDMKYRFLTGTDTDHSSGYYWSIGTSNRNGTSVNENSDNDSSGRFLSNTSNDDGTIAGEFVVYGPNQSAKTTITHAFIDRYEGSATAHPQYGGCWVNAGDQFTGIRLFGSYNWDALGKITVYGMADS